MAEMALPLSTPRPASNRWVRVVLGFLLILPAMLACLVTMVAPALYVTYLSFTDASFVRGLEGDLVGFDNFLALFEYDLFLDGLLTTLMVVGVRVLLVAVVAPLVGAGLGGRGKWLQAGIGVVAAAGIAAAFPLAVGTGLKTLISGYVFSRQPLLSFLAFDAVVTLVTACALGLTFYLAAHRQPEEAARRKSLWRLWGLSLVAAAAYGSQAFTTSYSLLGGQMAAPKTLVHVSYLTNFMTMRFGPGSALTVLLGIVLAVLGIAAVVMIVSGKLQIQMAERAGTDTRKKSIVWLVLALLAVVLVTLGLLAVYIMSLTGGLDFDLLGNPALPRAVFNSLVPSFALIFLLQLPITYFAALGIGGLRPLGKKSEWLLLLFAPGLFVASNLLVLAYFKAAMETDLFGSGWLAVSPVLINIFALVILTLFFKGQAQRWEASEPTTRGFFRHVVLPSIPLASLLGFVSLWLAIGDQLWQIVMTTHTDSVTLTALLMRMAFGARPVEAITILVLAGLVVGGLFFVIFALFQALYVNRLTLTVGAD